MDLLVGYTIFSRDGVSWIKRALAKASMNYEL